MDIFAVMPTMNNTVVLDVVSVKLAHEGITRRNRIGLAVFQSLHAFCEHVRDWFGKSFEGLETQGANLLQYKDCDSDWITIGNDAELTEALHHKVNECIVMRIVPGIRQRATRVTARCKVVCIKAQEEAQEDTIDSNTDTDNTPSALQQTINELKAKRMAVTAEHKQLLAECTAAKREQLQLCKKQQVEQRKLEAAEAKAIAKAAQQAEKEKVIQEKQAAAAKAKAVKIAAREAAAFGAKARKQAAKAAKEEARLAKEAHNQHQADDDDDVVEVISPVTPPVVDSLFFTTPNTESVCCDPIVEAVHESNTEPATPVEISEEPVIPYVHSEALAIMTSMGFEEEVATVFLDEHNGNIESAVGAFLGSIE